MSPRLLYRYEGGGAFRALNTGTVLQVDVSDPDPDPGPPPPPPASWQAAVDSHDFTQVETWYDTHTGHDGINPDNPGDLPLDEADLTWVEGGIKSEYDGQVLEGLASTYIRIYHNNVTVRRCLARGGATYGSATEPAHGSNLTGITIEYTTLDGGSPPVDKAAVLTSNNSTHGVTYRNVRMKGWSSGILANGGCNAEYCWTDDFFGSSVEGAHVSSFVARGAHVRFFRCYGTQGGSPIMSIYFDQRPVHHVELTENILSSRLSTSGNLPSYLLFGKNGSYETTATGIVVGGNYLGDTAGLDFQFNRTAGMGGVRWGEDGNVRTPDVDFTTGATI